MPVPLMDATELARRCRRLDALLEMHAPLWRSNPFRDPHPAWIGNHADLAATVRDLDEDRVAALEADPERLLALLGPHLEGLIETHRACEPERLRDPLPRPDRFACVGIPGRKWTQVLHFLAALPESTAPALEWCAGKGHLGRTVARVGARPVRCAERDPRLCAEGAARARNLPVSFECCDVLAQPPAIDRDTHLLALHACGALHERLIDLAIEQQAAHLSLAPCCYHLTPLWRGWARSAPAPELDHDDLHLAVQDTATAPRNVRRARLRERAFRAGFDALQRTLRGRDTYLPLPSLRGGGKQPDFAGFCNWAARHHDLELPADIDLRHWLRIGWRRDARIRRLELVRHGFRRIVELRIVYDRALHLAESGFRVGVARFCDRPVTPRNLLLQAWR